MSEVTQEQRDEDLEDDLLDIMQWIVQFGQYHSDTAMKMLRDRDAKSRKEANQQRDALKAQHEMVDKYVLEERSKLQTDVRTAEVRIDALKAELDQCHRIHQPRQHIQAIKRAQAAEARVGQLARDFETLAMDRNHCLRRAQDAEKRLAQVERERDEARGIGKTEADQSLLDANKNLCERMAALEAELGEARSLNGRTVRFRANEHADLRERISKLEGALRRLRDHHGDECADEAYCSEIGAVNRLLSQESR